MDQGQVSARTAPGLAIRLVWHSLSVMLLAHKQNVLARMQHGNERPQVALTGRMLMQSLGWSLLRQLHEMPSMSELQQYQSPATAASGGALPES